MCPKPRVMVIEHAERFGLAQLHQLRGRVGRGADASFCLLLHEDWVNETARRRLTLLRDTDDGFLIADEDFRLRGGGDALGTRQAGLPGYRLADPIEHEHLLHMAHRDAAVLLSRDPKLETTAWPSGPAAAAAVRADSGDAHPGRGVNWPGATVMLTIHAWMVRCRGLTDDLFVQQSEVITPAIFRNRYREDPAGARFLEILAEEALLPVVRHRLVVHGFWGEFHRSSRLGSR